MIIFFFAIMSGDRLWALLLTYAALPALPETDARYAKPSRSTYYPDYAVYHDVDRYNRYSAAAAAARQRRGRGCWRRALAWC